MGDDHYSIMGRVHNMFLFSFIVSVQKKSYFLGTCLCGFFYCVLV